MESVMAHRSQDDIRLKDDVYEIVGAAIEVHRTLGPGFLEAVYQESLGIEMGQRAIPFSAEKRLHLTYKSHKLTSFYVPDFLCFDSIVVEIKALDRLSGRETAQVLNAMKAAEVSVGLLINFGAVGKLEWKRFVL